MCRQHTVPTNRIEQCQMDHSLESQSGQENLDSKKKTIRRKRGAPNKKSVPRLAAKTTSRKRQITPPLAPQAKAPKTKIELEINQPHHQTQDNLNYGDQGYLEVTEGETFKRRYKLVKRLGVGAYASVYMATDKKSKKSVAMKIARSGDYYNSFSKKEVNFVQVAQGYSNIVSLIDDFTVEGLHGTHYVMVFEMLGPDLSSILLHSNQAELTVDRIKKFCRDILKGLDHLHTECGIVHLDLKPENMMVTIEDNMDLSDSSCPVSLKIGDFGISAWSDTCVNRLVQTCNYRAPEAHLGADIDTPADMWSFGAIAYEIATGGLLFPCYHVKNDESEIIAHFSQISGIVGPIRAAHFERTEKNRPYFEEAFGKKKMFKRYGTNWLCPSEIQKMCRMDKREASKFSDFLLRILKVDPKERLTAKQALEHPFLMG